MPVDPALIGPAMTALTQGVSMFGAMLPSISELRSTDPAVDTTKVADIRTGEIAAVVVTVGIGAVTSALTGSAVPVVVAVLVSVGLMCLYESFLRADRPMEPKAPALSIVGGAS